MASLEIQEKHILITGAGMIYCPLRLKINRQAGMYSDERGKYRTVLCVVWLIIVCISTIMTYYESLSTRKEIAVRTVMGYSGYIMALRSICADIVCYASIFFIMYKLVITYEGCRFLGDITITAGAVIVIADVVVLFFMRLVDFKKAFSGIREESGVLCASYVIKGITSVFLVVSIAGNMVDSVSYFETLSQKSLYDRYRGYKYIECYDNSGIIGENKSLSYSVGFYMNHMMDMDVTAFEWIVNKPDYNVIMANANFQWYLKDEIDEFSQIIDNCVRYMFIPESYKNNPELLENIRGWSMYLSDKSNKESDRVIYYRGNVKIPVQNSYDYSPYTYLVNPVICYSAQTDYTQSIMEDNYRMPQVILQKYFVNITEEQAKLVQNDARKYGVEVIVSDVYAVYEHNLTVQEKLCCIYIASFVGNISYNNNCKIGIYHKQKRDSY